MKYESPTVQRGINMRQGHAQGRINVEKPKNRKKTFARLAEYFFAERLGVLLLLFLVFVGVLGSVFAPKYQSSAIDCIAAGNFDEVSYFLTVMFVLYVINGLATMFQGYIGAVLSQRMTGRIRDDLFRKIVLLPISYTDSHQHGDLISRITNDADNISNVISQSLGSMFSGVLMLLGTVAMMMWHNIALALLSCSTVILTLFATAFLTKYMRKYYVRRQELLGALNGTINEMIGNTRTLTAYNRKNCGRAYQSRNNRGNNQFEHGSRDELPEQCFVCFCRGVRGMVCAPRIHNGRRNIGVYCLRAPVLPSRQ